MAPWTGEQAVRAWDTLITGEQVLQVGRHPGTPAQEQAEAEQQDRTKQ